MGLAATLTRQSLLRRPGRTLFSILGVALGIATVVCVFTLDHVTVLSRTWIDPSWRADLEVRALESVQDPRAELSATRGVADVAAFFQNEASVRKAAQDGDPGDGRPVHVVAIDAGAGAAIGAYRVALGRDLSAGAERPEALVGQAFAEASGVKLGDVLVVSRPMRAARTVCVEGELRREEREALPGPETEVAVVGMIADEAIGARSQGRVLVIDYDVGRRVFEGAFVEPRFWLKRDVAVDVEDLGASLGGDFSYELNRSQTVGEMEDERAFRNGVRMAGLLALILGLYVIFHTLSMSLVERVREVALLDSLGASRGQIARVFFAEALAIALCAGVAGVLGGLGLAKALLARGITTLGVVEQPVELLGVPWGLVVALAVLGVAIALCGSVYPLLRARNTDTVSALRGEAAGGGASLARGFQIFSAILLVVVLPALYFLVVPVVGAADAQVVGVVIAGLAVTALLVGLPLVVPSIVGHVCGRAARLCARPWPLAGRLVARSIENGPARIAVSVAAIALVTAAFVGLKGMTNSLAAEIEAWGSTAVADKVFVTNLPNVPIEATVARLHELPEVRAVESGDARTYVPFLLIGLRTDELARTGPCAADPELLRALKEDQGILVSGRLARHRDLSVGNQVAIHTSGHGVQAFRVAGITDDYGYFTHPDERIYGVVDDALLERFFCLDTQTTTSLAVTLEDGADPGVVSAAVLGGLPPGADAASIRFETGSELLAFQLADIDRDFVLFDILLGLTALLAGVGVLNGQLLSALERAQELGILRALGTSRRQIAGTVLLESAVLGATGGAVGLCVGSALTPLVVRALELVSGLPLPQRFAGAALAACFAGALAVTLLAGLYPIWRMNRLDPVRAVRMG